MELKIIIMIIIGLTGIGLTFARRYNNPRDKAAGMSIAGWTIGVLFLIAIDF